MKVTGKPVRTSVGVGFLTIALFAAIVLLPNAHESQSPVLYVLLLGGLFVGVPAALGIEIIIENARGRRRNVSRTSR